ncbi:MAG: hypothetical protein WED33_02825 [Bacteroidia bacterium]
MGKIIIVLSIVILTFASCDKCDQMELDSCLNPVFIRFDSTLAIDTNDFYWWAEKIYIPSAFTPNGDGINEVFSILTYLIDSQSKYSFQAELYDGNEQILSQSGDPSKSYRLINWDGRNAKNEIKPGIYRLKIKITKNGIDLINSFHHFYLLLPNENGELPLKNECLFYPANFDLRLGLIYEDGESYY